MKFETEIIKMGEMVEELLEGDMLIIFNENIPEDLAEISVLHKGSVLKENVVVGDTIKIGNFEYEITCVGSTANNTLRELGHCTFKFDGSTTPSLPGVINLKGDKLDITDIAEGDSIIIS